MTPPFGEFRGSNGSVTDVRGRGFARRLPLETAWQWLDACPAVLRTEWLPPAEALGCVLAEVVTAPGDLPPCDRAAMDGYALTAASTIGAGPYNPIPLPLSAATTSVAPEAVGLPSGTACPIAAGEALPIGADAVLPFAQAQRMGTTIEILAPVARGTGVQRRGGMLATAAVALPCGRRVGPVEVSIAGQLGLEAMPLVAPPRIRLVLAGPRLPDREALVPALRALVARDGGKVTMTDTGLDRLAGLLSAAGAETGPRADLLLIAGRSGDGLDDDAADRIAGAGGVLEQHGIAIQPGGSAGLGWLSDIPLILLPGEPLACLTAYELLAGRLIRRLAGQATGFPFPIRPLRLRRKIASAIGLAEFVPVTILGEEALPLATTAGLPALREADGFVLVPAALEGFAAGDAVPVNVTVG